MIGARLTELATLTSGLVEQIERNNDFIKIVEGRLAALRMGLAAWVSFKVDGGVCELGWAKPPGQDRWCLLVRDVPDANTAPENAPVRRLQVCPLRIRALAMKQFPMLLDALKEHAEEIVAAVQDAASVIEDIAPDPRAAVEAAVDGQARAKLRLDTLIEGSKPNCSDRAARRLAEQQAECRHTWVEGSCVRCGLRKTDLEPET
jgi:hypothetical protein